MSGTALSGAELELTQRVQRCFPRGVVPASRLHEWNTCPSEVLEKRLEEVFKEPPPSTRTLLKFAGRIKIPATSETFVAGKRFIQGTGRSEGVNFREIKGSFAASFLRNGGKKEPPIGEMTLRYYTLLQDARDSSMTNELGRELKHSITPLATVYSLLAMQPNGECGAMITCGWNVFYVLDISGYICDVGIFWGDDGWCVHEFRYDKEIGWYAHNPNPCRVFAPDVPDSQETVASA